MTRRGSLPILAAGARRRRPSRLGRAVLDWYAVNGRDLAFRRTRDPWAILVSEVMLQQTQVARVEPAWTAFTARFPSPRSLAGAALADVLRAWTGLGYNRRAVALQRAAAEIVARHHGRVPSDIGELEALPGVGPYTARAVAAIAFGRPVGAVDVNVRRVLSRIVASDEAEPTRSELQDLADRLVPPGRSGDWTHALMDLGAMVCRPRAPDCPSCPARPWCRSAFSEGERAGLDEPTTGRSRRATAVAAPFPSTNRWLRGRIVRDLATAPADVWMTVDGPIGQHDRAAVRRALMALETDGLIERDPDDRVRLPSRPIAAG